jgi:GNAT superfamily N-acetyltransferase
VSRPPRLRFRAATPSDADFLARIVDISSHGAIGGHYRELHGDKIDWRKQARADIASGGHELGHENAVIIQVDGRDAGGLFLNGLRNPIIISAPPESRTGVLERLIAIVAGSLLIREIAVLPPYRGRGLARLLIDLARDQAAARGIAEVSLTVNGRNAPARALYLSTGFVERTRVTFEGEEIILMSIPAARMG